ncbi:hypothetical protein [Desulfosporosinus sp. FKA]|uniref:hypothetical protein n=1 Tax=Desulfosporosinus sp. FKA TaxID=1969834 RepID=UPI000B4A372B|nr:hypothetical protein [Desulfosporosinus sp. FKA]
MVEAKLLPFYKNVDYDRKQNAKMAIVIVEGTSNQYTINPKNRQAFVESKIAWIVARLTGKASLNYKDVEISEACPGLSSWFFSLSPFSYRFMNTYHQNKLLYAVPINNGLWGYRD